MDIDPTCRRNFLTIIIIIRGCQFQDPANPKESESLWEY